MTLNKPKKRVNFYTKFTPICNIHKLNAKRIQSCIVEMTLLYTVKESPKVPAKIKFSNINNKYE